MYYEISVAATSSASAGSQSTSSHMKLLTGTGFAAWVKGVYAGARSGTAGGGQIKVITAATAQSSSGTTTAPSDRNPNFPTATTSGMTATTCSQLATLRVSIGAAQTGGMGGWVAIEPDASIALLGGGGANGNLEISSNFNAASIPVDITCEFSEQ